MTVANRTNYHSHCSFCDGKAPIGDFVAEAVRRGFTSYGVSSHAPLPFSAPWTLDRERVGEDLAEIARLQDLYAGRIELYAGMEIDYLDETWNPASPYFQQLPLDYRIGSVHLLRAPDGSIVDIDTAEEPFARNLEAHFGGDLRHLVEAYFDKLIRMVETGGFDFVGHADKMSYNASFCEKGLRERTWFRDKLRAYFERIAACGRMVEINTKKYGSCGVFFPHRDLFGWLRELRIPVTVNSDAHRPERIDEGRSEALAALYDAGIRTVAELRAGRWTEVPIDRP